MKLARTVRFDESDNNIFHRAAQPGEWAISGGFEFSNWSEADLTGKARQTFANGWLGLTSFGRSTLVAVARIEQVEIEAVTDNLARHFVDVYGAPSKTAARPVAEQEIAHMCDLCEDQNPNTILVVQRTLTQSGVKETFRTIQATGAELDQFAIHGHVE